MVLMKTNFSKVVTLVSYVSMEGQNIQTLVGEFSALAGVSEGWS